MSSLTVFDDIIPYHDRNHAYAFMRDSQYRIGWVDSHIEEHIRYANLHSIYSQTDLDNLPLYRRIMDSEAGQIVNGLSLTKAVVNLSVPSDVNFVHSHPEKKVILYYANMVWEEGWHGETLFFDDSQKNIKYASPYTPGRVIVFDGNIPHCIRPQSYLASNYRFTFALTFD